MSIGVIFLTLLIVDIKSNPSSFADYYGYVFITDDLYNHVSRNWYTFEPISSGLLYGLRVISDNSLTSTDIARYFLPLVFFLSLVVVARRYQSSWQSVLIIFALFGPMLAFVTLRATPAYFVVALAAMSASRGKYISIVLCLIGSLFHVSALLALPPLVISVFQNRFKALEWLNRRGSAIVLAIIAYGVLFFVFRDDIIAFFLKLMSVFPAAIGKYFVYFVSVDQDVSTPLPGHPASVYHVEYWAAASAFVIFFLLLNDDRCIRLRGYLLSSYIIFVFMEFSPGSAFRESLFWVIPGILAAPWNRLRVGGFRDVAIVLGSVVIFVVQFRNILAW